MLRREKRRLAVRKGNVRLGIMRHIFIIMDMSEAAGGNAESVLLGQTTGQQMLSDFIGEFFDQNPISQLGLIIAKNKKADVVTDLTGNIQKLQDGLQAIRDSGCNGEFSLQNALRLALQTLKHKPSHSSREILIMCSSLSTCDPDDILVTLKEVKKLKIRCSFICLAEVFVFRLISEQTSGSYSVLLDDGHLKDVLWSHAIPPVVPKDLDSNLIRMGFPVRRITRNDEPSMCVCHNDMDQLHRGFTKSGYFCTQCNSKYCSLPVQCSVCGITLISAPHLARSYHHLFPLPVFKEEAVTKQHAECYGCFRTLEVTAYSCTSCLRQFCADCDLFIHETLHTCPGC